MSEYNKTGLRNAGSFLVSGKPYMTGSSTVADDEFVVEFPKVTRDLMIEKTSGTGVLRVHFGSLSNNAIAVSGTMDFRTASDAFSIPEGGGASFAFWISGSDGIDTFNANENFIALQNEAGDNAIQFRPRNKSGSDGRYQVTSTDTAGGTYKSFSDTDPAYFANGWNHFVVAFNGAAGGAVKVYHNGAAVISSAGASANPLTGSTKFALLQDVDLGKVVGLDEVAVWGAELSAGNVTSLYNSGKKVDPTTIEGTNLKLWYQFGDNPADVIDGANTFIKDSSNNNDNLSDLTNYGAGDSITSCIGPFSGSNNVYQNHHYWPLATVGSSVKLDVKCRKVYLSSTGSAAGFELYAGLTHIPAESMYELSGSGVDE